jgi:CBS domain-containing protein
MNEKNIGVLTVVEIEDLVGILSERDCARKMILQKLDISTTKVKDIMTAKVISVDSHKSVEDCLALMNKNRFRHLPVIKEGKLDGLVSAMDLTKSVLAAQEFLIQQLDQYIKQG